MAAAPHSASYIAFALSGFSTESNRRPASSLALLYTLHEQSHTHIEIHTWTANTFRELSILFFRISSHFSINRSPVFPPSHHLILPIPPTIRYRCVLFIIFFFVLSFFFWISLRAFSFTSRLLLFFVVFFLFPFVRSFVLLCCNRMRDFMQKKKKKRWASRATLQNDSKNSINITQRGDMYMYIIMCI